MFPGSGFGLIHWQSSRALRGETGAGGRDRERQAQERPSEEGGEKPSSAEETLLITSPGVFPPQENLKATQHRLFLQWLTPDLLLFITIASCGPLFCFFFP
ncbi:hypothetical protein NDU88_000311 [Pleurodeles waltl]|uniref:Uncharacterized protein n=1 Tax=Pleurodeles waltl TaxID=8319 RepID=A0AAV7NBI5_PLEWA|nr:hypothetical protein NDU88_000311 [Pleurodeles waltl]